MLLLLLTACASPCQHVCLEMAQYADECGLTVSDDQVKQCQEAQAEGDGAFCASVNDPKELREWWTCDDLAKNFEDGTK